MIRVSTVLALCAAPIGALGQTLFFDDFESRIPGNISGQAGWLSVLGDTLVTTAGGANPPAFSGVQMASQMAAGSPTAVLRSSSPFGGRDAGNDILVIEAELRLPGSVNGLSTMFVGATGLLGATANRLGYVGLTSSGFFYGAEGAIFAAGTAARDTWHHVRVEIDTVAHTTTAYGDGTLLGSTSFDGATTLTNWTMESFGGPTGPVYFDDFRVQAISSPVPEPLTVGLMGATLAAAVRRRVRRNETRSRF